MISVSMVKSIQLVGQAFSQAPHNVQLSISMAAAFGLQILNGINAALRPIKPN